MDLSSKLMNYMWKIKESDYSFVYKFFASKELNYSRSDLDIIILRRLKKIIKFAEENSIYYKKIFQEYGVTSNQIYSVDDIKKFPFLTRSMLRDELSSLVTNSRFMHRWSKIATGGTTSSPVEFYCNESALWKKNAYSDAFNSWYGLEPGFKTAYLWGAPQDFSYEKSLKAKFRNYSYSKRLMLPSTPLDDQIMENYYLKLRTWRPYYLQAYPTPLYEFCVYLNNNNLKIPFLKSASVTAEILTLQQRELIESVLGFKIFNWYGSRELARVASECEIHNGMHINEPCVFVEIEHVPTLPEGWGNLIVTDLLNYATPLIRYRTGDVAVLKNESCPCGRSLRMLSKIEGRIADMIILSNGKKIPGVSLTNRIVKDFRDFKELQIIQKDYSIFNVKYVKGNKFNSTSLDKFLLTFREYLSSDLVVNFEEVFKILPEKSGKIRFVKNEILNDTSINL